MARIKISIDDIRAIPDGYDLLFLNPEITISELSLDHDMGLDYMDGYDLVKYMVHEDSMNIGSIERIQFHTDNMCGKIFNQKNVPHGAQTTMNIMIQNMTVMVF